METENLKIKVTIGDKTYLVPDVRLRHMRKDVIFNVHDILGIIPNISEEVPKESIEVEEMVNIGLDRKGLETLVKGSSPYYTAFSNDLVKRGGHYYSDQYGKTTWNTLGSLTNDELYQLYVICRNSWN
jgi:hypothetical protein